MRKSRSWLAWYSTTSSTPSGSDLREVDRYDTSESRHVLYECGPGRYRILVSRFDDGSEIYPEPELADESSGISYGFLTAGQAAARWPHKEHFAYFFPIEDVDE